MSDIYKSLFDYSTNDTSIPDEIYYRDMDIKALVEDTKFMLYDIECLVKERELMLKEIESLKQELSNYKRPNISSLKTMAYHQTPSDVDTIFNQQLLGMNRPYGKLGGKRRTRKSKRSMAF